MARKNVWVAGAAVPVVIGVLLLLAGSPSVTASDQSSRGKRGGQDR